MNTKQLLPLVVASLALSGGVAAAENETVFLNGQGKLVIPHLVIGDEIYYAQLDRVNPNSYTFNLDASTVANITPQEGDDWATEDEVLGTWGPEDSEIAVTLEADGSYSWDSPAQGGCPAGVESGTWNLNEETGVLSFRALEDANGVCGMSHPERVVRASRDGDNLVVTVSRMQGGAQVDTDLTLEPVAPEPVEE